METTIGDAMSLVVVIPQKLEAASNGTVDVTIKWGATMTMYEPVYIGLDYIEFMSGSTPGSRLVVLPTKNIVSMLF
jgi:hypothetical protein